MKSIISYSYNNAHLACFWFNFYTDRSQAEKRISLGYNKNYVILVLNYVLKNSKKMVSISGICRRDRNKNVIKEKNI